MCERFGLETECGARLWIGDRGVSTLCAVHIGIAPLGLKAHSPGPSGCRGAGAGCACVPCWGAAGPLTATLTIGTRSGRNTDKLQESSSNPHCERRTVSTHSDTLVCPRALDSTDLVELCGQGGLLPHHCKLESAVGGPLVVRPGMSLCVTSGGNALAQRACQSNGGRSLVLWALVLSPGPGRSPAKKQTLKSTT